MKGGLASISLASLSRQIRRSHLPKVRNFDRLMVAEQILRLEVTMEVVLFVHIGKALHGLEHDVSDHAFREELASFLH